MSAGESKGVGGEFREGREADARLMAPVLLYAGEVDANPTNDFLN